MQNWEYLTVQLLERKKGILKIPIMDSENFTEKLNIYGRQGWELVSTFSPITMGAGTGSTIGIFAIFKRPL